MRFYTTEQLSDKRHRTPEGFLVLSDVPLARTGWMEYNVAELALKPVPGTDIIKVQRTPEVVFDLATMASYAGKSFVNEHPKDDVTPANWKALEGGSILNPRRGTDDQDDLVIGDIMVKCPDMIRMVENNEKTEVSVGYDCDYDEIGPGEYAQRGIIVNHVALVEQGRCGPRCSIGDSKPQIRRSKVAKFTEYLTRAFKAKDAAELDAIVKDVEKEKPELVGGEEGDQHIHVHLNGGGAAPVKDDEEEEMEGGATNEVISLLKQLLAKLEGGGADKKAKDAEETAEEKEAREKKEKDKESKDKAMKDDETIEGALEMEAPPGTDDKARKAKDSSYLVDAWQQHIAYAEIIVPGGRMPTFDQSARPGVTLSKLCGARAALMERAYEDQKTRAIIDGISGGRVLDFKRMTCDSLRTMIASVATTIGSQNNAGDGFGAYAAKRGSGGGMGVAGKIKTPADLNRLAREQYSRA